LQSRLNADLRTVYAYACTGIRASFMRTDTACSPCRRHFLGMFHSRTYGALLPSVTALTLLSVMACLVETYFPVAAEKFPFEITDTPLSITSFALSLLLVFRTDASYARWGEALEAWGEVRSISLELVRYGLQCICDKQLQQVLARWVMAYSVSLKVSKGPGCWELVMMQQLRSSMFKPCAGHTLPTAASTRPHDACVSSACTTAHDLMPHHMHHSITPGLVKRHLPFL
jgi:hypothetical protein